ncbi:Chitinase II [Fusarium oxysporum f. sp. vasinfectum]|nr:Chitinase II [Fusarium oxysporum f. sp. vasinfectum]
MSSSRKSRIASSMSNVMFTNAVYFPNYRIYQGDTPGMLNYSCINHVYYAYASVSADGGVFLSDEWADAGAPVDGVQGGLGSLMHLKQKHPHLRVVLSIGGGNSSEIFPLVASSTLLRDNFARSAKGLVEASGLDGIDIAWEYPCDVQQGYDFLALLAAVRIHLPEEHYVLTAALPAAKSILQFLDLMEIAEYLDFINLMAYDFFGAGHKYKGVGGAEDGTFEYNQLPRKGCKEVVDKRHVAAHCTGADGGFVTYDNPDTVKIKAGFCKQKGLGGLFYWNGPADSKDKSRSLVAAGFRALHSS